VRPPRILPSRPSTSSSIKFRLCVRTFRTPVMVYPQAALGWEDDLRRDGYCVIPSVLDATEVAHARQVAETELPHMPHMAHSEAMWYVRTHPVVLAVFRRLWRSDDLIVGFDGMTVRRPGDEAWTLDWHVDQDASHERGLVCAQGVVALSHSDARTGGTQLVPGSHRHFAALSRRCGADADGIDGAWEFFAVGDDDYVFWQCAPTVQPSLNPGDLLLWDSRTVHRVAAPECSASARMVAYVCMTPRSFASADVLAKRRLAFQTGIATTHWPHRYVDRDEERAGCRRLKDAPPRVRALV
jgi:hypothetical protein